MSNVNDKPTMEEVKKKSPSEIDGDQSGHQADPRRNPEKKDEGKPTRTDEIGNKNPHGGEYRTD